MIKAVEHGLDVVLRVVPEQLEEGEHGKAAMLQLLQLARLELIRGEVGFAHVKVAKEAPVIDRA